MIHASTLEEMNFNGDYAAIPEHMQESIMNYAVFRKRPGEFLTAVICNDLRGAVGHADAQNFPLIKTYVQWFYNRCPQCLVGKENFVKHLSEPQIKIRETKD